ncbi:MAG: hypothetical protein ABFE07_17275 [Armatimonadia bacterium]
MVGQTEDGRNVITSVIELKYLDPYYAAEILQALGYGGSVIPLGHAPMYGGAGTGTGTGTGTSAGASRASGRSNRGGYGGTSEASRRSNQYPGYQSPYDYR